MTSTSRPPRARFSISAISMPDEPFDADVRVVREHGLGGLGIWGYKIEDVDIRHVRETLDRNGIRAANCIPVGNSIYPYVLSPDPADAKDRVEAFKRQIERMAALSPETVVVITGPQPQDVGIEAARERCRSAIAELGRTAHDAGVRLAVEPIHPMAAAGLCLFATLDEAGTFLDEIGDPHIGLLVDAWHVGQDPELEAALGRHRDRIAGVHLGDHHAAATGWTDRAFPSASGESAALIGHLEALGFAGSYDVEIFSDDGRLGAALPTSLWDLPVDEIVERCVGDIAASADA